MRSAQAQAKRVHALADVTYQQSETVTSDNLRDTKITLVNAFMRRAAPLRHGVCFRLGKRIVRSRAFLKVDSATLDVLVRISSVDYPY